MSPLPPIRTYVADHDGVRFVLSTSRDVNYAVAVLEEGSKWVVRQWFETKREALAYRNAADPFMLRSEVLIASRAPDAL